MPREVHVEETVEIAAPPPVVFATIIDVAAWGRFSPECTGATVLRDGSLAPGSRFSGHNRRGVRRWTTHCVVTELVPDTAFAFDSGAIGLPIASWSYRLEPVRDGRGTVVTEVWHDNRGALMRGIAVVVSGIADRATHNRAAMRVTLDRLKAHLETG
ncbi:SRPBCC family protein [Actinokineospora globicatena]|uniref:Polyketide cyclase / dehydrase and lipid transport n=1 Tax=Actinokineospora globicatena TaxID=103729 RepID=A0A9W6V5A4_9PSEU|nr:SRPBCC family protein [Actinokineospora globicatena]MCP2303355.1 Polyketide cyclase / dehydrase and lipid transport [Actinokineospora globicatena]GLW79512.1 hypothetical protein Aglo01_39940 [Actinokineospora globicatena]GLW86078.1 hypothetical protein Aglo02_37170 [Actinokineospora globicatena]GLW90125.1 hypothetical protein Aglo03_09410 [Actinokineospora globicatena]